MLLANFRANALDLARAAVDEVFAHFPGAAVVIDETTPRRALCAAPGRPHTATDGRLCREHFEELGTWLRDIETEAGQLDTRPSMQGRLGEGGGGSLASHQAPVVVDAVAYLDRRTSVDSRRYLGPTCVACEHVSCEAIHDTRGTERLRSVYGVLHRWAQQVRDERQMKVPTRHALDRLPPVGDRGPIAVDSHGVAGSARQVPAELTVTTERTVLTRQLDWIAQQPWVTVMREDVSELRDQLRRHNRNDDDRPLSGYCYRLVDDQGTECRGNLLPAPEPAYTAGADVEPDDGPHRPRAIVCERNASHRWEGRDLARLSLILERQKRETAQGRPTPPPAPVDRRLTIVHDDGLLAGDRLRSLLVEQDDAS